jgi:hypothetical protein
VILARTSRPVALAIVFIVSLLCTGLMLPLVAAPLLLEEPQRFGTLLGRYGEYLLEMFTFGWLDGIERPNWWLGAAALCVWPGLTVAFLSPIVGPVRAGETGRSLRASVIAASLLGASMCALLMAAVLECTMALLSADSDAFEAMLAAGSGAIWTVALGTWFCAGFLWMYLLRRAGRSRDPRGLDRVMRALVAGTAVELALGLPIYALARKKYDCYCAMATFLNLVFGIAALLWMCGPWAVLLLTRRARANWLRAACRACGYPRRSGSTVCTECGCAWDAEEGAAPDSASEARSNQASNG